MSRTTALDRAAAALLTAIAGGGAMAVSATFDELPAPLTSTRQTVRCTVTKSPGESRLLEIKVTSQSPTQPEEVLDEESFAPDPAVPQAELLCHFDSTHGKHGETVTFRVYAKTPEDADWVLEATEAREVVNGFVICVDTDPAPDGCYALFKEKLEAGNYGELTGLDSDSWTRNDYLGTLEPMQVHLVVCHGNPAGLVPPGGGGTITTNDVRAAVPGSEPSTKFAMIGACSASSTEAFLKAYLREGEPNTTNRHTVGFRKAVAYQQGEIFFRVYIGHQTNAGKSAGEAALFAAASTFGDENSPSWRAYGDPAARLRWLYDGAPGSKPGIWKVNP
ncbi:MAG: hypothetical protein AB7F50_10080 [Fimbriimonadaceae bacterium]